MDNSSCFDKINDRSGTGAFKWNSAVNPEYLPFTIADMEFQMPPEMQKALHNAVDHGICGYTEIDSIYKDAVFNFMARRHNFHPTRDSLVCTQGVVQALGALVRRLTEPGDEIIIQPPVYTPFSTVIQANKRTIVENRLLETESGYVMNYDELERLCKTAKMLILCSPHNPVGRVWKRDELQRLADICIANDVIILCDEIHSDIVYKGNTHTTFATLPGVAQHCIVCTSMSKTFNLAGGMLSNIFIENAEWRHALEDEMELIASHWIPFYSRAAAIAALTECDYWIDALLEYLSGNFEFCYDYVSKNMPILKCTKAQGTYLLWLDCRGLNMTDDELEHFLYHDAKFEASMGIHYNGTGFVRMNLAEPRSQIEQAFERLKAALVARGLA